MEATATLGRSVDPDECRRLAELLSLDAVGVVRTDGLRRRVAWWASPGTEVVPLDRILDGSASGWVAFPRGDDLVFAHMSDGAPGRSVATLSAMLAALAAQGDDANRELGGVAPEDPVQRERTKLAYAIHDGLTQVVTASILELEWHARRAEVTPEEAVDALNAAAAELRRALDEIRAVLASLSSHGPTAQPLDELIAGVMERWQLPASWTVEGDLRAVPRSVLDAVASVVRESVANAAKHASSNDVAVKVRVSSDGVEALIEDRGRGFRPEDTGMHAGHLGLEMMRRRVEELDGTLDIESSPGKGTRVIAKLPAPRPEDREQGVRP